MQALTTRVGFHLAAHQATICGQFNGGFMSDNITNVTDASFEEDVLKAEGVVLVDYWAEWCGPCKMIAPILEEVASDYAGRLKICKLNIDENSDTPPKFGIRGIPTLMLFKGGNVEATKVGALSKSQLIAFLDSNIAAK
jgi:thioredoxin 1